MATHAKLLRWDREDSRVLKLFDYNNGLKLAQCAASGIPQDLLRCAFSVCCAASVLLSWCDEGLRLHGSLGGNGNLFGNPDAEALQCRDTLGMIGKQANGANI
jgi:hypothetical protein